MTAVFLVAGGLGLVAGGIIYLVCARVAWGGGGKRSRWEKMPRAVRSVLMFEQQQSLADGLPLWAQEWSMTTRKRMERAGIRIPFGRYLMGVALAGLVGFVTGASLLNNLPAAVVLSLSAFLVPDVIVTGRIQARRTRMIEQLGAAVRVFSAEFNDTPQVPRALALTAQRLPAPLGGVFDRAVRDLGAGKDKNDVLLYLMRELDFEYGRMFVQLLRIAWEDAAVRPLFSRLAMRIGGLQELILKNRSQTSYGRWMGIAVNASIVPMFLIARKIVPDAGTFLTMHPLGWGLVFLSFFALLLGLLLDRLMSEVDI